MPTENDFLTGAVAMQVSGWVQGVKQAHQTLLREIEQMQEQIAKSELTEAEALKQIKELLKARIGE